MEIKKFIGTWKLLKWSATGTEGMVHFPFGEDALGFITYTDQYQMNVMLMKADRNHLDKNILSKSNKSLDIIDAYHSYISYGGQFEVIPEENLIIHRITMSSYPNWTNKNEKRKYEFYNNQLILETSFDQMNHQLVWERI